MMHAYNPSAVETETERVLGIYQKSGNVEDSLHYLSARADGSGHWAGRSRQHCH